MKQYLIGLLTVCMFVMPAQANQPTPPEIMIKVLNHCYEDENKIGTELAKCFLEKMKGVKNPNGYKIYFSVENFNKTIASPVSLTIYDKYGNAMICKGIAKEKIVFKDCIIKKIPNFSPGKAMSIDPEL